MHSLDAPFLSEAASRNLVDPIFTLTQLGSDEAKSFHDELVPHHIEPILWKRSAALPMPQPYGDPKQRQNND